MHNRYYLVNYDGQEVFATSYGNNYILIGLDGRDFVITTRTEAFTILDILEEVPREDVLRYLLKNGKNAN
jgi:hypothetical protein